MQEFHYGYPPPKNVIKNEDRKTHRDPVNHPASEILKAIGKLAPSDRIIVLVKDATRADMECEQPVDMTFRKNSPDTRESLASMQKNRAASRNCGFVWICVVGAASPVAKTMNNLRIPFEVWLQICIDTAFWRHGEFIVHRPQSASSQVKNGKKHQSI